MSSSCCPSGHPHEPDGLAAAPRDPVCGMVVSPSSPHRLTHAGREWLFCCPRCRERFAADPDSFLGAREPEAASPAPSSSCCHAAPTPGVYTCPMHPEVRQGAPGACPDCGMALERVGPPSLSGPTEWTCPMHPEVVRDSPGTCPLCGMALEPRTPAAGASDDGELADFGRRLRVAASLTVPLVLVSMGDMLPGRPVSAVLSAGARRWVELALATPVALWCAWPFFVRAVASVRSGRLNMFTLIGLGVGVAYVYSVVATVLPGVFPAAFRGDAGEVAVYFEAAAVITTLILLGQVLELRARRRTGAALESLFGLAAKSARRIRSDGGDEDVPVEAVHVGDRLRIRPGEKVPVDAVVLTGESHVDESMVTGEPEPARKSAGDEVIGGTINGQGSLVVRAAKVGADTLLARIVSLVADAQRTRAPIQRVADVVAGWFVPIVIGAACVTFAVWAFVGPEPRLAHAIVSAVAVLIIACPCALGLATPMSIVVAMGRGATMGVLFRNAEAIEMLRSVDTLVVDKTGTLTEGRPRLTQVAATGETPEHELLRLAASLERASEHPLGAAIVAGAEARGIALAAADGFEAVTGQGVKGRVSGRDVALGSRAFLESLGIDAGPVAERARAMRSGGRTVVLVAVDGAAAGLIGVADPVKETTHEALRDLRAEGIRIVMMTGDDEATARAVAESLGIDAGDVRAEVLPEDKADAVRRLQAEGGVVAMAGDGVNDAPALAAAQVGIAMGTGTDVAMESAGVTLVEGDLRGIVRARRLSRLTLRNIRQNLVFAFAYNAAGVPIAAGVLYPVFGWLLSPMIAAAAMSLSSVSVIANALRLRRAAV